MNLTIKQTKSIFILDHQQTTDHTEHCEQGNLYDNILIGITHN